MYRMRIGMTLKSIKRRRKEPCMKEQKPTGNETLSVKQQKRRRKRKKKSRQEKREMKIENESNDLPPLGVIIQGSDDDNDLIQFRKCIWYSLSLRLLIHFRGQQIAKHQNDLHPEFFYLVCVFFSCLPFFGYLWNAQYTRKYYVSAKRAQSTLFLSHHALKR